MSNRIEFVSNIIIEPFFKKIQYRENFWREKDLSFVRIHEVFNQDHISYLEAGEIGDIIVIFLKLESIAPNFMSRFYTLTKEEVEKNYYEIIEYYKTIWEFIRSHSNATILMNSFELEVNASNDLYNTINKNNYIERLNHSIKDMICKRGNTFIIDLNSVLMRLGYSNYYDFRYWYMSNSPYTNIAYKEIASYIEQYNKILNGHLIKCIVLDCDNILWGGIIGEDGLDGIRIGQEYPGNAYYRFQEKLLELNNSGITLLLSSKNNCKDVLEVFNKKQMPLSLNHIIDYRINWDDKAIGILDMITELNISMDSVLFIDDSKFEINLVKRMLPDISILHLPSNKPEHYVNILMDTGYFNILDHLKENGRNEYYISNKNRKNLKINSRSVDEYYKSLETEIRIFEATVNERERIVDLSIRTNQFNNSANRLTTLLVDTYIEEKNKMIFCLSVKDCFGDLGIVGYICIEFRDRLMFIEQLSVSCRALGRKIEEAFLDSIVFYGFSQKSISKIQVLYKKTAKNKMVQKFIAEKGFLSSGDNDIYETSRKDYIFFKHPEYFKSLVV